MQYIVKIKKPDILLALECIICAEYICYIYIWKGGGGLVAS